MMYTPLECIYRAIEYIEAHLQSELPVGEIAESAGYSLFHFIRTFNRLVHHTPYDYLMRRRLSEAARTLTASSRRIIDIAQDFCFESQESFSRAFKRMFDLQPSQWRDRRLESPILLMPPLTRADLEFISRDTFQFPSLVNLEQMALYGLAAAPGLDGWDQPGWRAHLFSDLNALYGGRVSCPVVAITTYLDPNCKTTRAFVGTENKGHLPACSELTSQNLPAGRYTKIEPVGDARQPALNYLYFTWLPRMGLRPCGQIEVEMYACAGNSSWQNSLYIPVIASSEPEPLLEVI